MKAKKILKGGCLSVLLLMGACGGLMKWIGANHPGGHNKYYHKIETTGEIETRYMQMGPHVVAYHEAPAEGALEKFKVWYPADIGEGETRYPLIISNNGTGWGASKYPEWFRHMASWGFIVVGNEEHSSWDGRAGQLSLEWILRQDSLSGSPLYHRVDKERIAAIGHSQGGTGTVNAVTVQPDAGRYNTAVLLANTFNGQSDLLIWTSDASQIRIPTLILVAENDILTPREDLRKLYAAIPDSVFKAMGRHVGVGHGDMLVFADGYVTAWMMWQLKGDTLATRAFTGGLPELSHNPKFIEVEISGMP